MKSFIEEFRTFALRGNALDLAVGVVIGAAFNGIVNSLVADVFAPVIGLLLGGVDFKELSVTLGGDAVIRYGAFIQTVISFIITAFALFLLIKFLNTFIRKQDDKKPPEAKSAELQVLEEIRDAVKK